RATGAMVKSPTSIPVLTLAEDGNPFSQVQAPPSGSPNFIAAPPGRRWSFTFKPPTDPITGNYIAGTVYLISHTSGVATDPASNNSVGQVGSLNPQDVWPGIANGTSQPVPLMQINFTLPAMPTPSVTANMPLSLPNNPPDLRNVPIAASRTVV